MVTIRDVAREAGVAISTVSYAFSGKGVLKEDTKKKVLDAADKLGYRPRPSHGASRGANSLPVIAVLLPGGPGEPPLDYHYLGESIRGLTEAAQDFGFLVTILYQKVKNPLFDYPLLCREKKIRGLLVNTLRAHDEKLESLIQERFPIILAQGNPTPSNLPTVGIDNVSGAFRATEHLIILGHTRIAMLLPGPTEILFSAGRFAGYTRALETYGVAFDPALVRNGELNASAAELAMGEILDQANPPTAVFAGNDTQAIGAIRAARLRGVSVPEDLAVVGFDDMPAASQSTPLLTTMHVPDYQLSAEAGRMLIRMILRPKVQPESIVLPSHLVIRESCGARSERLPGRLQKMAHQETHPSA